MFAIRIRNAALALAGAAIIATALMNSTAAAAPAGSLPLSASQETVAADLVLDRPTADIAVETLSESGDVHTTKLVSFRIKNLGPDTVTLKLTRGVSLIGSNGNGWVQESSHAHTIPSDATRTYSFNCDAPVGGSCHSAYLTTTFRGIDPNPSNNSAAFHFAN